MVREVHFYETAVGNRPVEKFLNSLDGDVREEILATMEYIEETEQISRSLFCKMKGTQDLWEVRVSFKLNIYRIICFFDGAKVVVAASGFQKKSQKTPKQEIETAHKRQKDYYRQR